ncbi:glucoamylase family protein [Ensifer soli]|uniref:glucoamylase family protein n=1 Tax=Ciceribacter sp. sgz301302 TaxID=3342379 RepID=UPI0035BB3144
MQQDGWMEGVPLASLQRSAFGYFLDHTDPGTGLVADTSAPGAPASIAATGFGLSAYPVAVERGFVTRREALKRTLACLRFLDDAPTGRQPGAASHRGFFYHFLDMRTGHRAWQSEASTMDTALLFAGVLMAQRYFDGADPGEAEVRERAARLFDRIDWAFALAGGDTMTMGWKPGRGRLAYRWQGYSEAILLHVLALGADTHSVPFSAYDAFTATYDWLAVEGRPYLYAGPLFIHLFSHAWIDFAGLRDAAMAARSTDYAENTRLAVATQRHYARENPQGFRGYGEDLWGLTACLGPTNADRSAGGAKRRRPSPGGYLARGAPFGPDDGTIAPWAPLACLPFAPEAALSATRHILQRYPGVLADGRFYGAFTPDLAGTGPEGFIDRRFTGLDQGLLVLMIENACSGLVWRLMRDVPVIRKGLIRAGFSGGWLGCGDRPVEGGEGLPRADAGRAGID